MGWLNRLFGQNKSQSQPAARQAPASTPQASRTSGTAQTTNSTPAASQSVPPERMGLNGEYDQSGLAKRVAAAFDDKIEDIETVYVAQTGSTVVLKGKVPNQQILDQLVSIAKGVRGATAVETNQVSVG